MKHQTIFKRSALIFAVLMLCLVTVFTSIPVMAEEAANAATIYDLIYSDEKNEWERKPVKDYPDVATAFKEAKDGQLVVLHQDANLFLEPYNTVKVDKGNYQLNVTTDAGYKVRTVENRDGTVTVTTYKGQGEWFSKLDVAVGGGFGMRFFFESLGTVAENDNAYLEVIVPQQDKTNYVRKLSKDDFKVDANGLYYFVANVAQAQLTDSIRFRIVVEDGNGKVIEYGRLRQYAFRDYADMLFVEADKTDAVAAVKEAVGDVKKMLNLGAQAQKLFNYNSGDLANDGIYGEAENGSDNPVNAQAIESTKEVLSKVGAAKKNEATNDSVTITPQEFSLYLQSRNALQFRFTVTGLVGDDVPTAAISYGENATRKVKALPGKLSTGGDCWVVSISNIPVSMYDTEFTVTLKYGGATATYSGSVLQWMYLALNSDKSTAEHKATATALYQYYLHVKGDEALVKPETESCDEHVNYKEIVKAATCTAAGSSRTVCSKCGFVEEDNKPIDPLGHDNKEYAAQDPTCITTGWPEYSECSRCGIITSGGKEYTSKQDILIATTAHNYSSEPSYSIQGKQVIRTGACTVCNKTSSEIVADYTDVITIESIDGKVIKEIGNTDTYDFKNQSLTAGNISVTYKTGAEGYTYYYKVDGGEYTEFNGNIGTDVAGKTVTIAVADSRVEGKIVVATIYNVGTVTCDHTGDTTDAVWVNGEGYVNVCSVCDQKYRVSPFAISKTTEDINHWIKYNSETKDYTKYDGIIDAEYIENNSAIHFEAISSEKLNGRVEFVNDRVSGRYFIVKYRTNKACGLEIYANTFNSSIFPYNGYSGQTSNQTTNFSTELSGDGKWHVLIIDVDASSGTYSKLNPADPVQPNANGKYSYKHFAVDLINYEDTAIPVGTYIDYAYIGWSESLTEIMSVLSETDKAIIQCEHNVLDKDEDGNVLWYSAPGSDKHWNICNICGQNVHATAHSSTTIVSEGNGKVHVEHCTDCGVEYNVNCTEATLIYNEESRKYDGVCECEAVVTAGKSYFLVMNDEGKKMSAENTTFEQLVDDDGTTYTRITESLTYNDDFFYMYVDGTEKTGQYMIIKYRVPTNYNNSTFGATYIGTTNSGLTRANGSKGDTCDAVGKVNKTGSWQIAVIDLSKTLAATRETVTITNKDGSTYIRSPKFIKDDDGCYYTSYVRMTVGNYHYNNTSGKCACVDTTGDGVVDHDSTKTMYMDVDFVAFADNLGAVANYITDKEIKTGEDGTVTNPCQHDFADQGGFVTVDGGHKGICAACGQVTGEVANHYAGYCTDNGDGTHNTYCVCGFLTGSEHHIPVSTKTHDQECKCGAKFVTEHSFSIPGAYNAETGEYDMHCACGETVSKKVNFVYSGHDMYNKLVSMSNNQETGVASREYVAATDDEVEFVRLNLKPESSGFHEYVMSFSSKTANPAGKYMVLKYRHNSNTRADGFKIYSDTFRSAASNENSAKTYATNIAGYSGWSVAIFDLSAITDYGKTSADGDKDASNTYTRYIRLGIYNGSNKFGENASFDIAYMAFADKIEDLSAYLAEENDAQYCKHDTGVTNGNYIWSDKYGAYASECSLCGSAKTKPFNVTVDAAYLSQSVMSPTSTYFKEELSLDKTTVKLTKVANGGATEYYNPIDISKYPLQGRYWVIKYRTSADYIGSFETYTNTAGGSTSITNTPGTTSTSSEIPASAKGKGWQIMIVDLEKIGTKTYNAGTNIGQEVDAWDPTKPATGFRFDYLNGMSTAPVGSWVEFEYMAVVTPEELAKVLGAENGSEGQYCSHSLGAGTAYDGDDINHWHNCTLCGGPVTKTAHTPDASVVPVSIGNGKHTISCSVCKLNYTIDCVPSEYKYNSESGKYDYCCKCGYVVETTYLVYKQEAIQWDAPTSESNAGIKSESLNENGVDFIRYSSLTATDDIYRNYIQNIYLNTDATKITGQYFVMRYRLTGSTSKAFSVYAATVASGATYAVNSNQLVGSSQAISADGNWHMLIVDLSTSKDFIKDSNGKYSASFVRLGYTSGDNAENDNLAVLDIDYIGFADNINAAILNIKDNGITECLHGYGVGDAYFVEGVGYQYNCIVCNEVDSSKTTRFRTYISAEDLYRDVAVGSATEALTKDGIFKITVDEGKTITGESRQHLGAKNLVGRYFIVKYRYGYNDGTQVGTATTKNGFEVWVNTHQDHVYAKDNYWRKDDAGNPLYQAYQLDENGQRVKNSEGKDVIVSTAITDEAVAKENKLELLKSGANLVPYKAGAVTSSRDLDTLIKSDGQWHILVIDLESLGTCDIKYEYGKDTYTFDRFEQSEDELYHIPGIYIDIINGANMKAGDTLEYDYLAFANTLDEITSVLSEEEKTYCQHKADSISTSIKNTWTYFEGEGYYQICNICGEAMNETPLAFLKEVDPAGKFEDNASVKVMREENGVKYKHVEYDTLGEGYGALWQGNSNVTGQYLVIKFRTNVVDFQFYVNKENESYQKAYKLADMDGYVKDEWNVMVFDLSKVPNITPTDGEYTISFLRMDHFNMPPASTTTYYLDVAFIGICKDLKAVEEYFSNQMIVSVDKKTYTEGETVEATLSLNNNPGFVAMPVALELTDSEGNVSYVTDFDSVTTVEGVSATDDNCILIESEALENYTANGELMTVSFKAPAAGEYTLRWVIINEDGCVNIDEKPVDFTSYKTTIKVTAAE